MSTLLDIANNPRTVPVQGHDIEVIGISAEGLTSLMLRFPEIGKMLSGGASNIDTAALAKMAPEAVAAVIAAGTGHPGEEKHERAAARLGIDDQLALLDEILRLTFPRGIGPFVERLERLGILMRVQKAEEQTPSAASSQPT